jgi:hypothetical protein
MTSEGSEWLFATNVPNVDGIVLTSARNKAFIYTSKARVDCVRALCDALVCSYQTFVLC